MIVKKVEGLVGPIGSDWLALGRGRAVKRTRALPEATAQHDGPVLIVNGEGLQPLQSRPSLTTYVQSIWQRRTFIWADARSKALRTTKDYRLWRVWLIVQPILDVALYGLLFGLLLRTSRGIENFTGFLILGVIFMRMLTGLLGQGNMLVQNSRGMIQTFQFPRASLVISQSLRSLIDNIIPAFVAVGMAIAFQWQVPLSWTILLVVPLFLLIHVLGCGLMFFTARMTAEIPDSRAIFNFLAQAWFFLSGVMFSVDQYDHFPVIQEIMRQNPAYIFLNSVRESAIYHNPPSLATWGILLAWALGTFITGLIYFWLAEEKYVRLT